MRGGVFTLVLIALLASLLPSGGEADDGRPHRRGVGVGVGRELAEEDGGSSDVGDVRGAEADSDGGGDGDGDGDVSDSSVEDVGGDGDLGDTATAVEAAAPPGGKVPLTEINSENEERGDWPSFLSTTLNVRLHPVDDTMNSARQTIFATAVTRFLNKVFDGQSTYDIAVRSVNVIQQTMAEAESRYRGRERERERRRLSKSQTTTDGRGRRRRVQLEPETLNVDVVVAAQYVEANSEKALTSENFGKLLLRIFNKFEDHLLQYMRDLEAEHSTNSSSDGKVYFASIESVVVESYLSSGATTAGAAVSGDEDGLNTSAIIAIVFGSLGLAAFVAAVFLKLSWDGKLGMGKKNRSKTKTARSASLDNNDYNLQDIKNLQSNSFAFSTNEEILKTVGSIGSHSSKKREKKKQKIPNIFRGKGGGSNKKDDEELEKQISKYDLSSRGGIVGEDEEQSRNNGGGSSSGSGTRLSSDETKLQTEMERIAQRREFTAPPGKLGVAIDSVNGHPVVHRIKEGSPLEGVLQRLDRIVAIDSTDTSNMSAADVTYLMVKGMNKPRKITYIRETGN